MCEVVARYPSVTADKLLLVTLPHLAQRGILNELGSIRKLGTFWHEAAKGMRHVGGQETVVFY